MKKCYIIISIFTFLHVLSSAQISTSPNSSSSNSDKDISVYYAKGIDDFQTIIYINEIELPGICSCRTEYFLDTNSNKSIIVEAKFVAKKSNGLQSICILSSTELKSEGKYLGYLKLGDQQKELFSHKVTLHVYPENSVTVLNTDPINVCHTKSLFSREMKEDFTIGLDNNAEIEIKIDDIQSILDLDSIEYGRFECTLERADSSVTAKSSKSIKINADYSDLHPGKYNGQVEINFNKDIKSQVIPIETYVKNGWLCPFILLIIGLWIGRKFRQTEMSADQLKYLGEANLLKRKINKILDSTIKDKFNQEVDEVINNIYGAIAITDFTTINNQIISLNEKVIKHLPGLFFDRGILKTHTMTSLIDPVLRRPLPVEDLVVKNEGWFMRTHKRLYYWLNRKPSLDKMLYLYTPWMYLTSVIIASLIVFKQYYINNDVFGQNCFFDPFTLFIAGLGITVVANLIFSDRVATWISSIVNP